MKRIGFALIVLNLVSFAIPAFGQRIPNLATPEHYQLTITPDFANENFAGDETIQIRILKTVRVNYVERAGDQIRGCNDSVRRQKPNRASNQRRKE